MGRRPVSVVPAASATQTFDESFSREVLKSERLRITAVVLGIALISGRWLLLWLFWPESVAGQVGAGLNLETMAGLTAVVVTYELLVLARITNLLRHGKRLPLPLRYVNAFVEISLPTSIMLFGMEASSPAYVLYAPPAWAYFLFIILATLRLDFWLCAFTGAAAAVQYALLSLYLFGQPQTAPLDPLLAAPLAHAVRVGLLVGAGVIAGVVSLQIRRQFLRALRSVEEQNRILGMFGQHVSPAVVQRLLSQDVELGGEVRHVCVMFLDIQGFTTYSESRRPEEVVAYLNRLFATMIDAVNDHGGIVNKFLGDGFMAVFGAPITDPSDCRNAVAASLEIIRRIEALAAAGEIEPTHIRIGLHAGEAVTGNVGSTARKEYTIIGDVVNLASRLEQLNKQFGSTLLVSETVVQRLGDDARRTVEAVPHGPMQVKGREQAVDVYELREPATPPPLAGPTPG